MPLKLESPVGFFTPFEQRSLGPVVLDAVIEETVTYSAAVTDHPVEAATRDGVRKASISDHVFLEPVTYTMRGVVSDYPITWRAFTNPYANASAKTRSISAYKLIIKHFEQREPFDLQTGLGILKNMVITSLRFPRTSRNSNAIDFVAEIREVIVVTPRAIQREKSPDDVSGEQAETQAVGEKNGGAASTRSAEQSIGASILDFLFGAP